MNIEKLMQSLSSMDDKELGSVEENAQRQLGQNQGKLADSAHKVIAEIGRIRSERAAATSKAKADADTELRKSLASRTFRERVELAFTAIVASEDETRILQLIADNPGQDFHKLAHSLGKKDGGYINLAVGTLCSKREAYLGTAPISRSRKGEQNFSSLLIDFEPHQEEDGSQWTGWTLKPDALVALQNVGVIKLKA